MCNSNLKAVLNVIAICYFTVVEAQNCDLNGKCQWSIKSGFVQENGQTSNDDKDLLSIYQQLHNKTGSFLLCHSGAGSKCVFQSDIVKSKATAGSLCFATRIFIGSIDKTTAKYDAVQIEVSLTNGKSIPQTHLANTSALEKEMWNDFSARFTKPLDSYSFRIDVTLSDSQTFVVFDDMKVDNCSLEQCDASDDFVCADGSCIKWESVCNLETDCNNGRDEAIATCGLMPTGSMCAFENGLCGWINGKRRRYSKPTMLWTLHSGPSENEGTGPSKDHTLGTEKGHYIYIETSNNYPLDYAVLESMVLPAIEDNGTGHPCKIRFFYHMFGKTIGKLEVSLLELCRRTRKRTLWTAYENYGDKWLYAEIPITNVSSWYKVFIEGHVGLLNHGDIAIDDLSLSPECYGIRHNHTHLLEESVHNNTMNMTEFLPKRKSWCGIPKIPDQQTEGNATSIPTTEPVTNVPEVRTLQQQQPFNISINYIIVITVASAILILGSVLLCFGIRKRKKQTRQSARLEMASSASDENCRNLPVQASSFDMQLRCAVTELNPNYDFITAKYPEQHLREIPRQSLTLLRLLGQGAFGEVYEGVLKNLCANVMELPVAVKTLPALSSEQAETDFLMEAVIISKFMHKNVVKCLGVCFEEHPRYIVLELLPGGDLRSFLRDSRPKPNNPCQISMEDLVKLALDVANGCRHLEEKHFVHRDVAARNCLLTTRDPGRIAKIADFGMSRDIYSADYYRKDGKAMLPIKWMPPEAFLDGVFTSKTDVWSFGILLWEIYTLGYMPYPGQTNSDVMHFVASGGRLDPPQNCPARLNKIMLMCWNSVADIRPAFSEIIDHLDMCLQTLMSQFLQELSHLGLHYLQDPEVMGCDMSVCHYPLAECLKDVSILVKSVPTDTSTEGDTSNVPSGETTADYGGHVASQSREPLLPAADENC